MRLNLRTSVDQGRFGDAERFFREHAGRLIVLDEAHEMQGALNLVHAQLEQQTLEQSELTPILLLSSSTSELRKNAAARLGTRMVSVDLWPIQPFELPDRAQDFATTASLGSSQPAAVETISQAEAPISLERLWLRGGFPKSLLAPSDQASGNWRRRYLASCFERADGGRGLRTTFEHIAACQGRQMPQAPLSASFRAQLAELQELGLVRILRPWFSNLEKRLTKPPKVYIRDSGLLHALRGCRTLDDLARMTGLHGESWEGFCVEALVVATDGMADPFYYRSEMRDELDLVLDFGGNRRWAVEIKHGSAPKPSAGFYRACNDVGAEHRFIVHRGEASISVAPDVRALTLQDALKEVLRAL